MNNILELKGEFKAANHPGKFGPANIPAGETISLKHLSALREQLEDQLLFWSNNEYISGALIGVYYKHVIAKSRRISILLTGSKVKTAESIRGSKFDYSKDVVRHVFVHFLDINELQQTIERIRKIEAFFDYLNQEILSHDDIAIINESKYPYRFKLLAKSTVINCIVEAFYIDKFDTVFPDDNIDERAIISFYQTNQTTSELLKKFGIDPLSTAYTLDDSTVLLSANDLRRIKKYAPYLIAMQHRDFSKISFDEICKKNNGQSERISLTIPDPTIEPIIGVIDTLFDSNAYFGKWVDEHNDILDPELYDENDFSNYKHGTAVCSIIVDGPKLNPKLDDGCGRFRVRHFGLATNEKMSSFTIIRQIREIVKENPDIKVWNLSLGADSEVDKSFISPEATELDQIQADQDVIFVISGTNDIEHTHKKRVGAPADSINSIVVNSVSMSGDPADYYRSGPVLEFFHKPDISYYGGTEDAPIVACSVNGLTTVTGTSFAAPWISRKLAYMINILGLSREAAKALLIDAAAGWNRKDTTAHNIGYGIVPIRIEEIINSNDDEIKFIINETVSSFETFTYNIPIPIYKGKQPFYARATLCYFPICSRLQGVDYTCSEMDIHFGRTKIRNNKVVIETLNNNNQNEEGSKLKEAYARKLYRKWDNVKCISETLRSKSYPKKVYGKGLWGLSIKTTERLSKNNGRGIRFGVVVTLKEMNGENHISDFIKLCSHAGWIVNEIKPQLRFDLFQKVEEEIVFE